jgi:hypothetical protein
VIEQPEIDESINLADAELVSKKRDKDEREKVEEDRLWQAVLKDHIGRRSLYKVLVAAGTFRDGLSAVTPTGHPDQYMTWYLHGQKEFGLRLYHSWLRVDFNLIKLMLDENDPRFQRRKRGAA